METKVHKSLLEASRQKAEPEKNKMNVNFKCSLQAHRMKRLWTHKRKGNVSAFTKWQSDFLGHPEISPHPTGPLSFQTKLFPFLKVENSPFSPQPRGPAPRWNSPRMSLVFCSSFNCNPSLQEQLGPHMYHPPPNGDEGKITEGTPNLRITCGYS